MINNNPPASSSTIDMNVSHYNIPELLAILGLSEAEFNETNVTQKTTFFIDQFFDQESMVAFFEEIQDTLLQALEQKLSHQTNEWIENEYLVQKDPNQANKVTQRKQRVQLYDDPNKHILMKKEELGVGNQFNVPISQDVLNPNLKNITERFINLDSQYRQTGMGATNYTLDLSDHLNDVVSLRLYSFQIPVTWYIIDTAYGNTAFWITYENYNILIEIAPGNYDPDTLVQALNRAIVAQHFTKTTAPQPWTPVTYNAINGKIQVDMYGAVYFGPDPENPYHSLRFTVNESTLLTFFDYTGQLKGTNNPCVNVSQTHYLNQTMGWILGYRLPYEQVLVQGNVGQAVVDLNGPRYLILVLDDLNRNHLNNGLVSITELSKTLKMPTYYSPDLPYVCIPQNIYATNLQANIQNSGIDPANNPTVATKCAPLNAGDLLLEKLNNNFQSYPQLVPSAPRTLTQSQLYTINEIIKNNEHNTNYRAKAPTTTDVFAIIPVKGGMKLGSLYTDFGGSLQSFKRSYFGPVNIDRLQVSLMDDRGNMLNLNGAEWSVTLIAEILYQY